MIRNLHLRGTRLFQGFSSDPHCSVQTLISSTICSTSSSTGHGRPPSPVITGRRKDNPNHPAGPDRGGEGRGVANHHTTLQLLEKVLTSHLISKSSVISPKFSWKQVMQGDHVLTVSVSQYDVTNLGGDCPLNHFNVQHLSPSVLSLQNILEQMRV